MFKNKQKTKKRLAGDPGFTDDDLAANRSGYLSKAQKRQLRGKSRQASHYGRASESVAKIGFFIFIIGASMNGSLALPLFFILGAAFLMINREDNSHRIDRDARENRAEMIEGTIELKSRWSKNLFIGKLRFAINYELVKTLHEGARYRVYYTPYSKTFLSMEPVHEEYFEEG
jgi:hypothetical protein